MGRVIMSGIVPTLKAPVTGVLASSLAVGSTVKLMEGGTARVGMRRNNKLKPVEVQPKK